jgi:hypothetical protein
MNSGVRHAVQRSRRVQLKADAVVLLDRLTARHAETFSDREAREIAELRMRLAPPIGTKAPIVLTGYTK